MKVLIVSDTHGYETNLHKVIEIEKPFDMLIHCGDLERDISDLQSLVDCPVAAVAGNNDYFYNLKPNDIFRIKDYTVLLTHGHRDGVYYGINNLLYKALENDADIVMFGHTHVPFIDEVDGVTFINPGSLTYPRQEKRIPTYAVMTIDEDDLIETEIKYL